MAAYNCAPGNVQKGIERTGYADFWELYKRNVLPRETKNYVPIIIALTLIAKDAAHYNIQAEPEAPVPTDVVKPGRAIDRKSTRLNSSHTVNSYAVFCLKKKTHTKTQHA